MNRIITIAGAPGSGKSSTAKRVAEALGFKHFSSGDLFRQIAAERGLSIEEINKTAELEQEIDHAVDQKLRDCATEDGLVIDSRLAYHWLPNSFKVYLALPLEKAAERIFAHVKDVGRESENAKTLEETLQNVRMRAESEKKRYMNLYGIDPSDLSPFDLVVDTEKNNLDQVVELVLKGYEKH